jgi:hypothetical protein
MACDRGHDCLVTGPVDVIRPLETELSCGWVFERTSSPARSSRKTQRADQRQIVGDPEGFRGGKSCAKAIGSCFHHARSGAVLNSFAVSGLTFVRASKTNPLPLKVYRWAAAHHSRELAFGSLIKRTLQLSATLR